VCEDRPTVEPLFTETLQVAIVVEDLENSMRVFVEDYGIGPWEISEFHPGSVDELQIGGRRIDHAFRTAGTTIGAVQWELIQPLDDQSIYAQFLRAHGPGLHHVAVGGRPYAETLAAFHRNGREVLQGGLFRGIRYAYLDTDRDLGAILELYDWPESLAPEPDGVYPP
jgi:hypothetical protein